MKNLKLFYLILGLFFSSHLLAQEADFDVFIKKFPKGKLPYTCAYKPHVKFIKSLKINKLEAETWLSMFKSPEGFDVNLYESLIEPFGPTKSSEGKKLVSKMQAQKVALLKQTDVYVMVLIRVSFLQQVADYMEGERYLLHTFKPDGTPISVLWIAQRIQFDLHYNQISSIIDESGNIVSLVENFAPSDTSKREEKYKINEEGVIEVVKE
jgi:hypothetical protein